MGTVFKLRVHCQIRIYISLMGLILYKTTSHSSSFISEFDDLYDDGFFFDLLCAI